MSGMAAGSGLRWLRAATVAGLVLLALLAVAARAEAAPVYAPVADSPFATGAGPLGVAFSPSGKLLATANDGFGANAVSVFSVNAATGALTPVSDSPFSTGTSPYSVAFSPSGGLLAVANFGAATVSVFSVNADTGALTPVSGSPFSTGSGPETVVFSPSGGLLATANHGANTVSVFSVNAGTGALTSVSGSPFATGSMPISVAFSPSGAQLATADFGANTVSVFSVNAGTGALTSVVGSPFATGGQPNSVKFSPSGGLLAVPNFFDDTVSMFSVDAGSGALAPVSGSPFSTGDGPGRLAFSPSGGLLAITDYNANTITMLSVAPPNVMIAEPADGGSYRLGQSVSTSFQCSDSLAGPGLSSCTDSNGAVGGVGTLDTSAPGSHQYSVTAVSSDGQSSTQTITYAVTAPSPAPTPPVTVPPTTPPATPPTTTTPTHVAAEKVVGRVHGQSARLGADVSAHNGPVTYRFQYGRTRRYGMVSRAQPLSPSTTAEPVQATARHLVPGVLYHYRLAVTNSDQTVSYGPDQAFRTPRVRPVKVRDHITSYGNQRAPRRYRLRGWLVLPHGLTQRTACRTRGYVTVAVTRGRRTIVTRRVRLTGRCTYNTKFSFGIHPRSGSGRISFRFTFTGNRQLSSLAGRTLKVRYGPRRIG